MLAYKDNSTFVHSADARLKMIFLVLFVGALLIFPRADVAFSVFVFVVLLYFSSKISLFEMFSELKFFWVIILLPIIIHAFFTREGIVYGIVRAIILFDLAALTFLLIYTTELKKLLRALVFFKFPKTLAFALTTSIRFISVLQREAERIKIAQASRGHEFRSVFSSLPLFVPLFHGVFRRALELSMSLEARAFDPQNIKISE
ncbi:MAG: energy-coupling factor transporter transmembrane component T [Candidatus Micrarchaeota archaeon]